jgi:hypothetical protein
VNTKRWVSVAASVTAVSGLAGVALQEAFGAESGVPRHGQRIAIGSTDYTDLGGVATVDSADFNDDGLVDVLVTRHNRDSMNTYALLVFLNDGKGRFPDGTASVFDGPIPRVMWPRKTVTRGSTARPSGAVHGSARTRAVHA